MTTTREVEQRESTMGTVRPKSFYIEYARSVPTALLAILIHSNILIALAAMGLGVTAMGVLGFPFDPVPLAFVFVATFFGYTINRFTDRHVDSYNLPERTSFIDRFGMVGLLTGTTSLVLALGATLVYYPRLLPLALLPVGVALVYSTTLTRRYFIIKNGLVGAIWAGIPIGLGVYYGVGISSTLLVFAGLVFLFLSAAAILFDIKDIPGDRKIGSDTLPVRVGPGRSRHIVGVLLLLTVPLILIATISMNGRLFVLLAYPGYLLGVLPFATQHRGALFYGGVIDGEHILIGGLTAILFLF